MPLNTPDVSVASPVFKTLSIRYIDKSGDKRTDSTRIKADATLANIQTMLVALGAITNASIYEVKVSDSWGGTPAIADAIQSPRSSVFQNVVTFWKVGATLTTQDTYIPAPTDSIIDAGTDTIITTPAGLYDAYRQATLAVLDVGYSARTVRYTERKEVNTKKELL